MKWTIDYIDALKQKLKVESDYALARHLGVSRQYMTKIKQGEALSESLSLKVATELRIDPIQVIATSKAQKEKNQDLRAIWVKLAREHGNK